MLFPFPAPERRRRFEEREDAGETGDCMTGLDWDVLIVELARDGRLDEFLGLVALGGVDTAVIKSVGFSGSRGLAGFPATAEIGPSLVLVG
jgi:hypothetical protein